MTDTQIHPLGTVIAPGDFVIPGSAKLKLIAAYGSFNGAAAGGDFLPLLRIISDAGSVAVEAVSDTTIAAGGSADASWFPGVKGGGSTATSTSVAFARAYRDGLTVGSDPPQAVPANSNVDASFPHAETTDATVMSWRTQILQNDTLDLHALGTYLCWVTTHYEIASLNLSSILINATETGFPHTPWQPTKVPRFADAVGTADNMDMNVLHVTTGGNSLLVSHSNNTGIDRAVQQCYLTVVYLAA